MKRTDKRRHNKGVKGKAGRKPIEDKKIPVQVYYPSSKIELLGGIENVRKQVLSYLDENIYSLTGKGLHD